MEKDLEKCGCGSDCGCGEHNHEGHECGCGGHDHDHDACGCGCGEHESFVIDLQDEVRKGGSYIISEDLKNEIRNVLNSNEQSIIVLNRMLLELLSLLLRNHLL